jgi:hypothetical protein
MASNSAHRTTLADFSPHDAALSCEDVAAERQKLADDMKAANGRIEANRHDNQVAGFIGATVMPLAYLATEGNASDRDIIALSYARQDLLIKLSALKAC